MRCAMMISLILSLVIMLVTAGCTNMTARQECTNPETAEAADTAETTLASGAVGTAPPLEHDRQRQASRVTHHRLAEPNPDASAGRHGWRAIAGPVS
jgi:hypothetical protein